jgi:RNA polymerase primary sigma factor
MDLAAYYESISREPLLTKDEEQDLFKLLADKGLSVKERSKIRDRILKANLRYPFKLAKQYSRGDPQVFEELICAGNEGLVVALEKFQPERGFRFLSYAGFWVSQRILKQMSGHRIVALPIYRQQLAARIQKVQAANENIKFDELKEYFPEVAEKDLKELSETRFLTFHLEDMGDDPSLEIDPISDEVETRIDRERLHEVVNNLPDMHKAIVIKFFGLNGDDEKTYTEISKELKISKDQLREYKKEAFEMLRERLADYIDR